MGFINQLTKNFKKKTDNPASVHQKELIFSYYGVIEIIWNKFLIFFKVNFVKKAPIMQF